MEMRDQRVCFLIKLGLLLLPFFLLCLPSAISGESKSVAEIARLQAVEGRQLLFGPLYSEENYWFYKAEMTRLNKPSVLIVGDSRTLQIREMFFRDNVDVYNAGYTGLNAADMRYFLEQHEDLALDTVIFCLSQFSFNPEDTAVLNMNPTHNRYNEMRNTSLFHTSFKMWDSVIQRKIPIKQLFSGLLEPDLMGLNATVYQNGMMNDGSMYYGRTYQSAQKDPDPAVRMADTLNRITAANSRFEHAAHMNPEALDSLDNLLAYCEGRNLHVIAYAPPYAPAVNKAMLDAGEAYGYQKEMQQAVPVVFYQYGYEFYDYTDASALGCDDGYYLDGFHGSDVVYARMFADMVERGSQLKEICDLRILKQYDLERYSDLQLRGSWRYYE